MALALARLRPSTVISTVVPRATPTGETELSVGGVMRLPVGESPAITGDSARMAFRSQDFRMIDLINLQDPIKQACCQRSSVRRKLKPEGPVRQTGHCANFA